MASLFHFFTEDEIEQINIALEAQYKKWIAVHNKPIQGYGKATEYKKKDEALKKAENFRKIQSIISENLY